MAKPDWLSIDEIIRLWSEETGADFAACRQDLEEWFAQFVKEPPMSRQLAPGVTFDTIVANRLLGMLGAHYLERRTFEAYCEERGHSKPRFWFAGPDAASEPAGPSPEPPRQGTIQQAASAASAAPLETAAHGMSRGGTIRLAGLAALLGALVAWGAETAIRRADNDRPPAESEIAAVTAERGATESDRQPVLDDGGRPIPESATGEVAAPAEVTRLRTENVRLTDQLAKTQAVVKALREAQQQADELAAARRQEEWLAATVSSARVAALQSELASAGEHIANPNKNLKPSDREPEVAATSRAAAPEAARPLDLIAGARQANPSERQDAGYADAIPETQEVLTAAEFQADAATLQTAALPDAVSSNGLLLDPGRYDGRAVVVIGSVVWLFRRFWLQSDGGNERMLIDVDGLPADDRQKLEEAVVRIETLVQTRARITGTIEKDASEDYRLRATGLLLED